MNRRSYIRLAAALLAATILALNVAPAFAEGVSAQGVPTFTFRGTGFGHGIGMSQYGARGSALAGKDYRWIIAHYFRGTTIGTVADGEAKVNIDCAYKDSSYPGRPYWTLRSVGSKLRVWRTNNADPTVELAADTWYRFHSDGTNIIVRTETGAEVTRLGYDVYAAPAGGSPGLIEVKEKSTSTDGAYHALDANGWPTDGWAYVRYRGKMTLQRKGSRVAAVNRLPIDQYLYGVVPREMPASWGTDTPHALRAQAVAARSYAYADVVGGNVLKCTTYSQVYKGHSRLSGGAVVMHEDSRSNSAVSATALQVAKSGSTVIKAYFFSHSGGHTANNEDVWISGTPLSWARGVPDTYEYLANPPYSPWPAYKQKTLTGLELANKLRGLTGVPASPTYVTNMIFERAGSGHVRYVTFRFNNGASARVSGDTVRSKVGLLSTAFYASGFPIARIQGNNRYETAAAISARSYPTTSTAAVLASGETFPDALTGSAVAGTADGPLLLTTKSSLAPAAAAELGRLKPSTVYIMGSAAAVSAVVEQSVKALLPQAKLVRLGGANRYETSRLAAEFVSTTAGTSTAIVASGTSWPDAAAASALAYARSYPILLTPGDRLGPDATAFLSSKKPTLTLVAGGPPSMAAALDGQIKGATGGRALRRLAGADRYTTAAEIARYCVGYEGFGTDEVYIATGVVYPDALAGGTLAGTLRKPLLLTQTDYCKPGTAAFLDQYQASIKNIWLFGSSGAISEKGLKSIDDVMMR